MLFKSSASPKENPGSKRLRRTLGLLLGSALTVQYKQDRIFRASVNLQLVMVLNYLYAAYNLLIVNLQMLRILSVWRIRQMDLCSRVFIHASMLRTFEHKSAWL